MNKRNKYLAGCFVMAACWMVGVHSLRSKPPEIARNNIKVLLECESHAVESALELPSESEIIGIEFALFEPLPDIKAILKKNTLKNKAQNKSGQTSGHKVK